MVWKPRGKHNCRVYPGSRVCSQGVGRGDPPTAGFKCESLSAGRNKIALVTHKQGKVLLQCVFGEKHAPSSLDVPLGWTTLICRVVQTERK